ncbi:integral membrane protein [Streptomyces viridosporus ATCC 14672]|uniref:Integral membrane protein n=1 Tax=Streptomyces viridosporus (strain ATCC 14672 / DSM 40746 / JCM 4963 / KCTC 9882 / NRRL B-12104 / FH 1290) TaxID=566461 RepID=D5ZZA6_STRV1|nr:acyltransferase [Streptomyces viridosporus]EFE69174.1 integral membrane protein [Streptomyces viridosporus ATCC 14672]
MTHGHTTGTGTSPEPAGPYGTPYAGDATGTPGGPYPGNAHGTPGGPYAGNAHGTPGAPHVLPQQRATEPAPDPSAAPTAPGKPGRDRYLDLLRSVALVRVVVYHLFGWAWLTVLFPSMGVMFALAGSLMARSLKRPATSVIRSRVRRLLPPLWAFAAVVLTLLFASGWDPAKDPGQGVWGLVKLVNYLIPIGAPPYPWDAGALGPFESSWATQAAGPLWYLRAYLWFVLASPLLLRLFRRAPWPTLLAPLGLTAIVGTGLVTIPGETGNAVTDFAVYGSCWVLGFAHQEGMLKQVPRYLSVSCASLVMAFGLWWASNHPAADGWNLNDIPLAQATWSFGFVVILLQYSPSWRELPGRLAKWDRLVTLSNNRAVTIYLWHNLLIMLTVPLVDLLYRIPFMQSERGVEALSSTYTLWMFAFVWPLIGLAVLAVGWVEDLAAKRKPRLWPNGAKRSAGRRSGTGAARRG